MGAQVEGIGGFLADEEDGRIRHLLFSVRGVLVDWNPRAALVGQYPQGVIDMVLDPCDEWGIWRYRTLMNLGWDEERALADYESTLGPAVAWVFRLYLERFALTITGMQPGMDELLDDLHDQGFTLWGLSNTTRSHARLAERKLETLGLLDGALISAEEHVQMPDSLFFQLALRRFGISPTQAVFIGDSPDQVEAAESCGIRSILFKGADHLREEILKLS